MKIWKRITALFMAVAIGAATLVWVAPVSAAEKASESETTSLSQVMTEECENETDKLDKEDDLYPESESETESKEPESISESELAEEKRYQYDDSGEAVFTKSFKVYGSGAVILRTLDGQLIDVLKGNSEKKFRYYDGSGAPKDVMVQVVADDGVTLSSYTTTWYVDGQTMVPESAAEYDLGVSSYERGHYMTQFKYDEDYVICFSDAKMPAVRTSRLSLGTYTGSATYYSYNNPDGSGDTALFGGGYLVCDKDGSDLAGSTLYMSYCTSGHSKYNPRTGMRGTYKVTITRVTDTYLYGTIQWTNTNGSFQNLGGTFSRKNEDFYIEVEKTIGGNMNHIYDTTEYKEEDLSATFKVYSDKACTEYVGQIKTDSDGSSKEKLQVDRAGKYYIVETKSSKMFSVNSKVYSIDIGETGTSEIIQIPNRYYKAKVKGVKKDALTGTTKPFSDLLSLKGAEYTVYGDKACTAALMTGTTDEKGNINFEEPYFTLGTYYIKETKAPAGYNIDPTIHEVKISVSELGVNEEASNSNYNNVLNTYEFVSSDPPQVGKAQIKKISSNPSVTNGNSCYSIKGAVFKIVNADTGNEWPEQFVIDEKGVSQEITLLAGNYYVEEVSSPPGYELLKGVQYPLKVENDATKGVELKIKNDPVNDPVNLILKKLDKETNEAIAMGNGELKGAQYTLNYYDGYYKTEAELSGIKPTRTWVLETNDKGQILFAAANKVAGDDFYYDTLTGVRIIPLGTLSIKETKAPEGYLLDEKTYIQNFTAELGSGEVITSYQVKESGEPVIRGGSSIQKFDYEYDQADEQGDATRKDAVFELVNRSEKAIKYLADGKMYEPGDVIDTFKTDKEGVARTVQRALPYGTYEWREVQAPEGYLNEGIVSQTFSIRTEGQYEEMKTSDTAIKNTIKRGSGSIEKWDNEIDKKQPQGEMTLDGAIFELYNRSENPVLIKEADGTLREVEVDGLIGTFTTVDGVAATIENYLPYGTYEWREKNAPLGYLHTGVLSSIFKIREDGTNVHCGTTETSIKNDPIRYDIKGIKVGEGTNERLSNVPFEIISDTTGETHIIVTDKNGMFSTESSWNPHEQNTNRGESEYDGVWFGDISKLDETKGALLYDTYTLRELRCEANKGYELLEFKIYPSLRHGTTIDLGTLDDPLPEPIQIGTSAKDAETDLQYGYAGETTTIIDTVTYKNVTAGDTYTVVGTLVLKKNGQVFTVNGEAVTASTEFKAKKTEGAVDVTFTFDSSALKGQSVVVFEHMYLAGEVVASHADLNDSGQTVEYKDPELGTKAADVESNTNRANIGEKTAIKDIVSYANLIPGKEYTVKGILMDKGTGEPLLLSNGKTVNSEITFTAKKSEGTVEVVFEFDSNELAGKTIVVFESLEYGGREIGIHADIEDQNQSIEFVGPIIGTTATDQVTEDHVAYVSEETVIIDVVAYENLIPGQEYILKGHVMDKDTGKTLKINGKEVTVEKEFTPKQANGSVNMEFIFSSLELEGKSVVIFEEVFYQDRIIATHSDIEDEGQTVEFYDPSLATTASEKKTGAKEITAAGKVTIEDVIKYENLIPGKHYTVKGILMDKESNKPLLIAGKEVTAEKKFKAKKKKGSVTVSFEIDASELKNRKVVVFETLYFADREIATHSDISDKNQTVTFVEKQAKTTGVISGGAEGKSGSITAKLAASVKTGDYTKLFPYVLAAGLALLVIAVIIMKKKRKDT